MDKLTKTAKILDVLAKVIFWICIVLGAASVIGSAAAMLTDAEVLAEKTNVSLTFARYDITGSNFYVNGLDSEGQKIAACITMLLAAFCLAFVCWGIKVIRDILKPMKDGTPFDTAVSCNLKKLGIISLTGGIITTVINLIGYFMIRSTFIITSPITGENVSFAASNLQLDATFLVITAVLFLLSYIFRYGEELQKQSDETL